MLIQTIVSTETTIFQDESNAVFGAFLQRLFIKSFFFNISKFYLTMVRYIFTNI